MRKRTFLSTIFLVVVFSLTCAIPVFGSETRASEYIATCVASVIKSGRTIVVDASITTPFGITIEQIGVQKIVVQESPNGYSSWETVETLYAKDNINFMESNDTHYKKLINVYNGSIGKWYRCIVTCYAGNSNGGDTATVTTNSIQI